MSKLWPSKGVWVMGSEKTQTRKWISTGRTKLPTVGERNYTIIIKKPN